MVGGEEGYDREVVDKLCGWMICSHVVKVAHRQAACLPLFCYDALPD